MIAPQLMTFRAGDGYEWCYRQFEPAGTSKGHIIAVHGIQSHGGWYAATNQWLSEQGWRVSFLERRGCGLNKIARGDCPSFRRLLDDIAEFIKIQKQDTFGPLVLVGISWGGKLAVAFQKRHRGLCDGLVLITPGFKPKVRPRLFQRIRIFINRLAHPTQLFPIPLNEPELFTDNPARQQFIAADPLALRHATARLLFESARMDVYLKIAAKRVRCPTLVLLAGQDRIINNKKTQRFLRRFKRTKVEVVTFESAHHTLEFEPAGPPFYRELEKWLEQLRKTQSS